MIWTFGQGHRLTNAQMNRNINNAEPLISVVIPAYNVARWIEATVQSVLAQSYRNLEVIVVDDGSTDGTASIVEKLAERDNRVRLLKMDNKGVGGARNAGIRIARGELIAPLDGDDIWHPDKLNRQLKRYRRLLDQGRPVGLIYCWSQTINEDGRVLRSNVPRKPTEGAVFENLLVEDFMSNGSTALIAAEALESVGLYLENREASGCADWELYLRVAHKYEIFAVDAYLVGYRRYSDSMSTNFNAMLTAHEAMLESIRNYAPDTPPTLLRDSRTGLVGWMLVCSRPGSSIFWRLLKLLFRNDLLFFARKVSLRLFRHVLRAILLRLLRVSRGVPAGERFLVG